MEDRGEPPDVIYTEHYDDYMYLDDDSYRNLFNKREDIMKRIAKRENIRTFNSDDFIYHNLDSSKFSDESKYDLKTYYSLNGLLQKKKIQIKRLQKRR